MSFFRDVVLVVLHSSIGPCSRLLACLSANLMKHLGDLGTLLPQIMLKPKDVPILCGAVAGKAARLLTCDAADFGEVMRRLYQLLKVITPAMLERALKKLGII